jgi:2-amino-4-hydroxy-6-hydroxymethyldihydropteridine diphosphokinase
MRVLDKACGMVYDVYIALGSNIGDREAYLLNAMRMLQGHRGVSLRALSGVYQTAPVGYIHQDPFLNMVCRVEVSLNPFELLEALQKIEAKLARERNIHWGPRTIDLDILLYGDKNIATSTLTVPHPRMFERAFVLAPLRDIYPLEEIRGKSLEERLESCADLGGISLYRLQEEVESLLGGQETHCQQFKN